MTAEGFPTALTFSSGKRARGGALEPTAVRARCDVFGQLSDGGAADTPPLEADFVGDHGRAVQFAALRFSPPSSCSSEIATRRSRLVLSVVKKVDGRIVQNGRERPTGADNILRFDLMRPLRVEVGTGRALPPAPLCPSCRGSTNSRSRPSTRTRAPVALCRDGLLGAGGVIL